MPAVLPAVLARINGEPVERWEMENGLKRLESRAGATVPAERRDEVLRGVLDQLIDFHVLAMESRARKLPVSDADVKTRLADIRKEFATEEVFKQGLALQGLTVEQLERQTRMTLEVTKLVDTAVTKQVAVKDAEIDEFYAKNPDHFKQGESLRASHILIGLPENASDAQKQQARDKAQQLLEQLKKGSDFAALAKAESQDPGSAPNGGDLGFFQKGQMVPAFDAAAFALKIGQLSEVVETPFGYHIIKVAEHRAPRTVPLAEAKPEIKQFMEQQQGSALFEELVSQIKAKTKIEVLV